MGEKGIWDQDSAFLYLQRQGYYLTPQFAWKGPYHRKPTAEELDAISYLQREMDFGGLEK